MLSVGILIGLVCLTIILFAVGLCCIDIGNSQFFLNLSGLFCFIAVFYFIFCAGFMKKTVLAYTVPAAITRTNNVSVITYTDKDSRTRCFVDKTVPVYNATNIEIEVYFRYNRFEGKLSQRAVTIIK
jgi:hypothetical protein